MGLFNSNLFNFGQFGQTGSGTGQGVSLLPPTSVNSTTYVDLIGVLVGLTRIPGESSQDFLVRLEDAIRSRRDSTYIGILNEIRLNLALPVDEAFSVSATQSEFFNIDCSVAGVTMTAGSNSITVPLLTIDGDGFWVWKKISDIADEITNSGFFSATFIGPDGPALRIAEQSNTGLIINEPIAGQAIQIQNPQIIPGSEAFNNAVPHYTISSDYSALYFDAPVPNGTQITYQYRKCPYTVLSSPVGLFSFLDPAFSSIAVTSNDSLVYQVQEAMQTLVAADGSYWAN